MWPLVVGWVIKSRRDEATSPPLITPPLGQHSIGPQLQLSSTPNQLPELQSLLGCALLPHAHARVGLLLPFLYK